MAGMESVKSVSSRESLCSVGSSTSEEEEEEERPCSGGFEVFLSDSEGEPDRLPRPLLPCQEAQGFFFPPEAGQTSPRTRCCHHKHQVRRPLGLLASARRSPTDSRGRYPNTLNQTYCPRFLAVDRDLSREGTDRKSRAHRARKRHCAVLGESRPHKHTVQPPLCGLKKARTTGVELQDEPHCWTEGDSLFAQKCLELQGFIRPLRELLQRLKMGRLDRGLSTFQQSVAMDRIQRIIGVLQKPEMGERYLHTLLQVETMLKVWFPHVTAKDPCVDCCVVAPEENPSRTAPQSPTGETLTNAPQKGFVDPVLPGGKPTPPCASAAHTLSDWPSMNLTWIHTVPISNPPLGQADVGQGSTIFREAVLGTPTAGAYSVIVFLQNSPVAPVPFGRPTSVNSARAAPACCHSKSLFPGPGEPPRCQSLPATTAITGSCVRRAGLGSHSQSLPYLPASVKEPEPLRSAHGRPLRGSNS